jgi:hypothetical protein
MITPAPFLGTEVADILPTIDVTSVKRKGILAAPAQGLQIVSGADAYECKDAIVITLQLDNQGALEDKPEREFAGAEIFNGAILPGPFRAIKVEWTKTGVYAGTTPPPLRVRLIKFPHRTAIAQTPTPFGQPVIDIMDGNATSAASGYSVIYDDGDESAFTHNAENMTWGEGIGSSARNGPHYCPKRRLFIMSTVNNATAGHRILIETELQTAGSWFPMINLDEELMVTDVVGSWRTIKTPADGILVPPSIRIRYFNPDASAATPGIWMSFLS